MKISAIWNITPVTSLQKAISPIKILVNDNYLDEPQDTYFKKEQS